MPTQAGRRGSIAEGLARAPRYILDALDGAHATGYDHGHTDGWWAGYAAREAELIAREATLRESFRRFAGLPTHRTLVEARTAPPERTDIAWRCNRRAELLDACRRDWGLT